MCYGTGSGSTSVTVGFASLPVNHVPIGSSGVFGTKNIDEFKNMELLWSGSVSLPKSYSELSSLFGTTAATKAENAKILLLYTSDGIIAVDWSRNYYTMHSFLSPGLTFSVSNGYRYVDVAASKQNSQIYISPNAITLKATTIDVQMMSWSKNNSGTESAPDVYHLVMIK